MLHPLVLTDVMRSRLRGAVRALLADPGLAGVPDAVRWAAVVLLSRTGAGEASVEIRTPELGRWCGLSADRTRTVVNGLRGAKLHDGIQPVVTTGVKASSTNADEALVCTLVPVARSLATAVGPAGRCPETGERDPLVLERGELAVLHGVVEAVAGPGFVHRDGRISPPGLLAHRTGHGAAVDRLAVLLMVLDAGAHGRVRLCGGRVDTEIGRPAITLSRMLGCSPLAAVRVLARLTEAGLVERPRRGASGLRSRSRLVLPAVAAAHQAGMVGMGEASTAGDGHAAGARPGGRAEAGGPGRKPARGRRGRAGHPAVGGGQVETVLHQDGAGPVHEPAPASPNLWEGFDHIEPVEEPLLLDLEGVGYGRRPAAGTPSVSTPPAPEGEEPENMQVKMLEEVDKSGVADLAVTTPLHALHSPTAQVGGDLDVVGGFSGKAVVVADHRRPERAGTRGDHGPAGEEVQVGAGLPVTDCGGRPLRGEKPKTSAIEYTREGTRTPARHGRQPAPKRRMMTAPQPPADLLAALAPVAGLWDRLERPWERDRITTAVRDELGVIARWTGPQDARQQLAERLRHRLKVEGGSARVNDPVGWMLTKGLPQRQLCASPACDDQIALDTGGDCGSCEMRIADRRHTRRLLVREVIAQNPGVERPQLRHAIDQRLRQHAELRAEQQVADRQQAEWQRAEADARRAVRQAQAEAAEAARQALPCEDCGTEQAAGLCASCWAVRATRDAIRECVNLALAGSADLGDHRDVNAIASHVRGELRAEMLRTRPAGADLSGLRASDLLTAHNAAAEYRASALALLARCPLADAEAEQAHAAAMRSAHRHSTRASAQEAADGAAEKARTTTAQHLLARHLGMVEALRRRAGRTRTADLACEAANA
ncbi:hypothetical protein [Kitasatospora sp. NPDC094015]|uniref:hypothetical protein n=1 Tax=Kitasatospora sp. NPDC094015 TaxID=3155205 RepID=UPI00331DEC63